MGKHVQVKVVVGKAVFFEADDLDGLVADLIEEAAYWRTVFARGVRSIHSDTEFRPHYSEVTPAVRAHSFKNGSLDLKGRAELAIYPARSSVEGKALAHYASTEIAFAILRYLWAEAGWLNEHETNEGADKVAEGIGELLVTAMRLGSSFR